jgi:hypothetical protein
MNNCRRELKTAHRTSVPTKTKVCDNLTKGEFPGGNKNKNASAGDDDDDVKYS